jgi:demethylmenaquinone methyltransferase / 2-methoxy-6-polyprenyl-1,4-benzoquinol methylase
VKWEGRFSSPQRKREYVRGLFSTIAPRYDLITVLLSFGQDRRWKRRLASMHQPAGESVLDLACGTGDLAYELARRGPRKVVGLDITPLMLDLARAKGDADGHTVALVAGDMSSLPFPDATFDLVTTGYGLRNVPLLETALAETARVLRPGGVLLSLDFNKPDDRFVRALYLGYLSAVGSILGRILHGDPDTYRYIPESIRRYPGGEGIRSAVLVAGFARCEMFPVFGGLMTIHRAVK